MSTDSEWIAGVRAHLLAAQQTDGGWAYLEGQASATEPTALSILALAGQSGTDGVLDAAAEWLLARRRDDGLFTACEAHIEPSWLSPLAGLALYRLGRAACADTVAAALLAMPVYAFHASVPGTYGYDTRIPGWPWTAGDFSFVEPTCLAMILLKKLGHGGHARVRDAARMLRDRMLPGSGWNYGEPSVLGGALYPTMLPTALALIALGDEQDDLTWAACDWLLAQRDTTCALLSLGWSAVALNVLGRLDETWTSRLRGCWQEMPASRRGPMEGALCLLGVADPQDHPMKVNT